MKKPFIVGLTGGLGSGKSTVLKMLKKKGAFVIDADAIVQKLLKTDRKTLSAIRSRFGDGVFDSRGRLLKPALAKVVFNDARRRNHLERIIHPAVRRAMRRAMKDCRKKIAVWDVPLLYEKGWKSHFKRIVVVDAPDRVRIRRLLERGLKRSDILARFRAQWPLNKKKKQADFVVDNSRSIADTKKQVDQIWKILNTELE